MPIGMLKGIRQNIITEYKSQKERNKIENVQYDSTAKYSDSKFFDSKIKNVKKDDFVKVKLLQ